MKLNNMTRVFLGAIIAFTSLQVRAQSAENVQARVNELRSEIKQLNDLKLKGVDRTVESGRQLLVLTGTAALTLLTKGLYRNHNTTIGKALLTGSILESAVIKFDIDKIESSITDKRIALAIMDRQVKNISATGSSSETRELYEQQSQQVKEYMKELREDISRLEAIKMYGVSTSLSMKQVVVGASAAGLFFLTRGAGAKLEKQIGSSLLAFTASEALIVELDTIAVDKAIAQLSEDLARIESQIQK